MEAEEIDGPEQDEEVTLSLDIKYGKDGRVRRAIRTVSPTSGRRSKDRRHHLLQRTDLYALGTGETSAMVTHASRPGLGQLR